MIGRRLGALVIVTMLALALPAHAMGDVRREVTARRPYIVELGEPYAISLEALDQEAKRTSGLAEYLADYGYPDYAEIQEILPQWPWDTYEVRLYYLRRNIQTDFAHVIVSPGMPDLGLMKFIGTIPPEKAEAIRLSLASRYAPRPDYAVAAAPQAQPSHGLSPEWLARIEAAAERAAQAADRAIADSEAASLAADRTERITERMEQAGSTRGR